MAPGVTSDRSAGMTAALSAKGSPRVGGNSPAGETAPTARQLRLGLLVETLIQLAWAYVSAAQLLREQVVQLGVDVTAQRANDRGDPRIVAAGCRETADSTLLHRGGKLWLFSAMKQTAGMFDFQARVVATARPQRYRVY